MMSNLWPKGNCFEPHNLPVYIAGRLPNPYLNDLCLDSLKIIWSAKGSSEAGLWGWFGVCGLLDQEPVWALLDPVPSLHLHVGLSSA